MMSAAMANERLITLAPYVSEGLWVFDDDSVGLLQEPFVAGIDRILDDMTAHIEGAVNGFLLEILASPLDGAQAQLVLIETDAEQWSHYALAGTDRTGALCPALFLYYDEAPRNLWLRASTLSEMPAEASGL